ncbi:HPF/RaiA family ribosome-associated protein [Teredinibacter waterburyi]|jgi:Sigma 54 modulation protein / S30EA ribosomal protein.|uniref:HPF/RaiA family ribosome-associated protein n=1 Tax=Teredinibacter waterburyi TaxID=1500538 RepID=UPI00165F1F01|nr:HPF/RaiA family ribosome-associated protein [Teredinibacter waterburyi]
MKSYADVVYRDFDASPALNDIIQKKVEKLHRFSDAIMHSRVVLESPHKHKHKGKLFRASIEIGLKGVPLTVTQDNSSVHLAVKEAFAVAERKVKESTDKRRDVRH